MEKELLEVFDTAEKAADAAAADGGVAYEDRCVDALKRMRKMPVTTKDLVATQVGKRIRSLTKHPKPTIQIVANDLFKFWKSIVIDETSKDGNKTSNSDDRKLLKSETNSEKSNTIKIEKSPKVASSKTVVHSKSEIKFEMSPLDKGLASDKLFRSEIKIERNMKGVSGSTAYERINGIETVKIERISNEEKTIFNKKQVVLPVPPKLTSMIKCNDPLRDKIRELLQEAFSRVPAEVGEDERDEVRNVLDEVNTCDPIRVSVTVESAMFEKLGRSNGTHKVKYRSIMFNLKDSKNTDLRRRVLLGHVVPEKLISMTAEEMASDERKLSNKQIQEKALFECERAGAPKATTDQFRCSKCGQRKCTYYQLQTRSADEPMTTFVTCVNCNNHWKFC